ncbi:tetratricopeptide repeat protein [Lachnospiraceae bacterium CLA-AA-H183]
MIESVKELAGISLAIFESIFASKICDFQNHKDTLAYFNKFDESIISLIHEQIKDEYEVEKLQDFILKTPLLSEKKYEFITEDMKTSFIDSFYKKNRDLRYIGSKRINNCLETYIDKINELLNNVLSIEGKILLQQINTSTTSVLSAIETTNQTVNDIKEILTSQTNDPCIPNYYNIPRRNRLFFGRVNILNNLITELTANKLVFLTGPGGIGKSQIAREAVAQLQNKYELVLWFSATSENELLEEYNNFAVYYKLITQKNNELNSISKIVFSFINRFSTSLIVFDGADDLSIDFFVQKCPCNNSDIIVTTQNSNVDSDEFSVIPVDVFDIDESTSFLLNYTSHRQCYKTDNDSARSLSSMLENYPLALEYARAYINQMHISIKDYFNLYTANKQKILNTTITSYKKTAYTAWKISYDKVLQQSAAAKDILNLVSLFDSNNIPLYDIFLSHEQYTVYEFNQIISAITSYSLFTINGKIADTHGITQEFIRLQMQDDNEYQHYVEKALQLFTDLLPQKITCSSERDVANLLLKHTIKLLSYSCLNNETTIRLSANIASKLYVLGNYIEVINFVQEQIDQYKCDEYEFSICEIVIFSIQSYHYIGKDADALSLLEKYANIVTLSEVLSNIQKDYLLSLYKNIEGIIQKDQGKYEESINTFLEALEYIEKMKDNAADDSKTNILNNIGNSYRNIFQLDKALEYYERALACSHNYKHQFLRIYGNIGLTHKLLGNYELAIHYFQPALDYSIELGDKRNECIGLEHLGNCYICMHEYDKALPFLEKSLQIANNMELAIAKVNVYYDYGSLAFHQEKYSEAEQYWKLCIKMSIPINYKKGISLAQIALSELPN